MRLTNSPRPTLPRLTRPSTIRPQVLGVIQVGDDHLERRVEVRFGSGDLLQHRLEQLPHILPRLFQVPESLPLAGDGVQDREIELLVGGAEVGHQVEDQVDDLFGAGVLAVDLVDDDYRFEAEFYRFAEDEAGLGHRAFGGVNQQEAAVDHAEHALDLAAEVRVAGGVDYVDLDALVLDRRVLRQDGNAALPFEYVGVHGPLGDLLPVPQLQSLLQQTIHERRLPVVDVRDNSDVAVIH